MWGALAFGGKALEGINGSTAVRVSPLGWGDLRGLLNGLWPIAPIHRQTFNGHSYVKERREAPSAARLLPESVSLRPIRESIGTL